MSKELIIDRELGKCNKHRYGIAPTIIYFDSRFWECPLCEALEKIEDLNKKIEDLRGRDNGLD